MAPPEGKPSHQSSNHVSPIYIGIDAGTSGIRACAINKNGDILASRSLSLPLPEHTDEGGVQQDPAIWRNTLMAVLQQMAQDIDLDAVAALGIDGTSGTVMLVNEHDEPLTPALMYNDARAYSEVQRLKEIAPTSSPVHAVTAGLPKIMWLAEQTDKRLVRHISHQADWLTGLFTHLPGHSDVNNCLKTGYEPINRNWPDWLDQAVSREWLPKVRKPGEPVASINADAARLFGLSKNAMIVAGTTDSHAAILATGIRRVGDAVTSLGSTLVTKIISPKPIFNSQYGIYSQPFGDNWLVGGASNSGGAVLRKYFNDEKMLALSQIIDAEHNTDLDYYPLLTTGERFPINDPAMQPRLSPRPDNEALFFQGMLEGIAKIEQQAYQLLHKLGAAYPTSVRTVGGGAINKKWTRIRAKFLDVDMLDAEHTEAAYGSALLARQAQLR